MLVACRLAGLSALEASVSSLIPSLRVNLGKGPNSPFALLTLPVSKRPRSIASSMTPMPARWPS
jgi:hypothetical protein